MSSLPFSVVFVGASTPIPGTSFQQIDATHWASNITLRLHLFCRIIQTSSSPSSPTLHTQVLDVAPLAGASIINLKEVAFFLLQPNSLPPDTALSLYVSNNGTDWSFRGFISNTHPSEVSPLSWPPHWTQPSTTLPSSLDTTTTNSNDMSHPQIGIILEPLAHASSLQSSKIGAREDFAKRVGLDLFNFMQSFGGVQNVGGDHLLVPTNVLDSWFRRLSNKLERDPDFLTRSKELV
jgi:protein Hikeshi